MTRLTTIVTSVVVATALVLPATASAQASRRGGGSDGGSSSSGGSRGGSDGGGGSVAVPRNPSPQPAPAPRGEGGSSNAGAARPSSVRTPSGPDSRGPSGRNTRDAEELRLRSAQATRGVAQPRGDVRPAPRAPRDYGNRWDGWYGYGPSSYYRYGYYGYTPYLYGGGAWSWNRYGWHDPFLFDPFGYAGYGPYYWTSPDSSRTRDDDDGQPTGSLRLRVNPSHARVYVDGALAGVASEFGGLTNHLTIPAGPHQIELRADGFAPRTFEVNVAEGRTRTERLTLQKLPDAAPVR